MAETEKNTANGNKLQIRNSTVDFLVFTRDAHEDGIGVRVQNKMNYAVHGNTAAIAKAFAESEFEQYRIIQDRLYQSDFDRLIADAEENDE